MSDLPKKMKICQAEIDQKPCQHCGRYVLAGCPLGDIKSCGHQDRTSMKLSEQLRIKAGMIDMGEQIAFGSDSALMIEAARAIDNLEDEAKLLSAQILELQERRDRMFDDMLLWRGIDRDVGDIPCKVCAGSGVRSYSNTTTWRGGIGGQMDTGDICDKCWGSGNAEKIWLNLRSLPMTFNDKA